MERSEKEKLAAITLVAEKIIQTAYHTLLLEMRFIDVALARLKPTPSKDVAYLGTNGESLFYNEVALVQMYQRNTNKVTHDVLHILLHCVFRHLFYKKSQLPYWNIACDVAVEQLISTLNAPSVKLNHPVLMEELKTFEKFVQPFTPQNLMTYFSIRNYSEDQMDFLEKLFYVDDHSCWHTPTEQEKKEKEQQEKEQQQEMRNAAAQLAMLPSISMEDLEKVWGKVSRSVEMNMISFFKDQGSQASSLQMHLKEINREPYDYGKFLKKFAQKQEVAKVNQDEFDYIFYTYGLNMYENMPLIEPLEYKDSHLIRDFVIAIDTSGSTSGDVVTQFLTKTYTMLKSEETFSSVINLYIIQCDSEIQEVTHITNTHDMESYIKNLTINGLGGTDFRPVFQYVQQLIDEKVFNRLKGLIYFTDGYGTFPNEKTPYDTAFVFVVKEDYENVTVPPWAIKVLLTENEIREFKEQ